MNRFSQFQRFFPQYTEVQPSFTPTRNFDSISDNFKLSIFHNAYDAPTRNDMLIIIPFFNPCNSVRMLQNMLLVKHKLEKSKIPFIVIHCIFPNSVSIADESRTYMTVHSNSYAFLKENLANIAIKRFQSFYSKFLINDCDIIFEEKDWYDRVSESLDDADIVQPFNTFKNLDKNFNDIAREGVSLFAAYQQQRENIDVMQGHPGYLIAFTKYFWNSHYYPDENLIGGGDTLICSLALKTKLFEKHHNVEHMEHIYNKYVNDLEIKTNYVENTIYHLYHNISSNRQYTTRYFLLKNHINENTSYNTITDIIFKNSDNVYEWIDEVRDEINNDILSYFASRQDDEVPNTI
jgi:hypothetical protein